jgi:uncharacterized damage-inducible protein DinB
MLLVFSSAPDVLRRKRMLRFQTMRINNFILGLIAIASLATAQDSMKDAGAGWAPEFKMAGRQIIALAEAIPADKYGWRPAPGVRSVSEALMHTASGNYFFLRSMGVKSSEDLPKDAEKSITAKADVIKWLKASFDAVTENYPKIDKQAPVKFLGHDATCDGVLLRALAHANEHLGQIIAYARMNSVVPPWSK